MPVSGHTLRCSNLCSSGCCERTHLSSSTPCHFRYPPVFVRSCCWTRFRPFTVASRGAFFFLHRKMSITCQLHVHPCHWLPDRQNTRRARMTRRPPVPECRDETTCLRPNVLTSHKVSLDRKARHSKWNCSEHLHQRQPARNVRQTDAAESHCCRTTKSAPTGTPLTP